MAVIKVNVLHAQLEAHGEEPTGKFIRIVGRIHFSVATWLQVLTFCWLEAGCCPQVLVTIYSSFHVGLTWLCTSLSPEESSSSRLRRHLICCNVTTEITFHHPILWIRSKSQILPQLTEKGLHKDVNPRSWESLGVNLGSVCDIRYFKIKKKKWMCWYMITYNSHFVMVLKYVDKFFDTPTLRRGIYIPPPWLRANHS